MGILDNKTRIIDFILTEKGRELLANNLLDFSYYSFFDENIDYQVLTTASSDYEMSEIKTPILEANLINLSNINKAYSVPIGSRTEPEVYIPDEEIILEKRESRDLLSTLDLSVFNPVESPVGFVFALNLENQNQEILRLNQNIGEVRALGAIVPSRNAFVSNNFAGSVASLQQQMSNIIQTRNNNLIQLTEDIFIDPETGLIVQNSTGSITDLFQDEVRIFSAVDIKTVPINLLNGQNKNGFLIEVFLSGTGSQLEKLNSKDIINLKTGDIISRGFENWFNVQEVGEDK